MLNNSRIVTLLDWIRLSIKDLNIDGINITNNNGRLYISILNDNDEALTRILRVIGLRDTYFYFSNEKDNLGRVLRFIIEVNNYEKYNGV